MKTFKIEERVSEYVGHTWAMDDIETARARKTYLAGANAQREIDTEKAWLQIENNIYEMQLKLPLSGACAYYRDRFLEAMNRQLERQKKNI